MKLNKSFIIGLIAVAGLSSCVSEEFSTGGQKSGEGRMVLDVSVLQPKATRNSSDYTEEQLANMTKVTNFPVTVYDSEGAVVKQYASVSAFPTSGVMLPVGNYTVEAHSNLTLQKKMDVPYYEGTEPMEIVNRLTTDTRVVCKMKNSVIDVNYSEEFLSLYTTWTITIDDGGETALSFTNSDGNDPENVYWLFEEGITKLTINFRGTRNDGTPVTDRIQLDKSKATEHYDDDNDTFNGGDVLVLNFDPTEATTGEVTGITLNATVTFELTSANDEVVTVNLTDSKLKDDSGEDDPSEPVDPQPGDDNAIVLTIPAPVTLSADESATADPSSGDVAMSAEKGFKSISVKVESSSAEMMEQLAAVADEYAGVDLVNGCEVVGNQNLVAFLGSLGKEITVPAEGDTQYTFPVGQFYLFLGILPGTHNFIMTVTDMEGNQKSGTVQVTITN